MKYDAFQSVRALLLCAGPEVEPTRGRKPIIRKKVVLLAMFLDFLMRNLLERAISVFDVSDAQGAVGGPPAITESLVSDG